MNILTFDIEEWFHILDNDSTKTEKEWSNYESRLHKNMDRIFSMLAESEQRATFFCLGWVAEKYPEVVRRIDALGYEVGSHSDMHQLVYEQKPEEFKADLERSIGRIQDITGKKVTSYRSPGFSLTEECVWAFDILAEAGIEIDCSIFPAARAHGGFAGVHLEEPFLIKRNNYVLKEFPINTFKFLNRKLIFSGGGYFRLFPYSVIDSLMKKSPYVMTYFHPRDFDEDQPIIENLGYFKRFKSYYGLAGSAPKLEKLLKNFSFVDLQQGDQEINWDKAPVVNF